MIDSRRPASPSVGTAAHRPAIELVAELLDQSLLVLRARNITFGDQHLSMARLHPQEAHGPIMSKAGGRLREPL